MAVLHSFLWDYSDLLFIFNSLSARISYFLISSLLQYFPLFILCIADTLLSARLGPKMLLFFFKLWQMIQSLNRLFVFQRVTPTPYNSTLVGVHSMCSLSIHAHFVLMHEPEKMTSGQWAFQSPPRLCPKTRFSASVPCWFGAVCSYILHSHFLRFKSLMSALIGSRTQRYTLRSSSCFFTELLKLHTTDFFPPSPLSVFTPA